MSAIWGFDAPKGIEPQTGKLFEVCRLRSVPSITFVNKVDREGRAVFETLDEVADALALDVCPMSWPIGMGGVFEGVLDFATNTIARPEGDSREFLGKRDSVSSNWGHVPPEVVEEIELAQVGYPEFDIEAYSHGDLTSGYFGPARQPFGAPARTRAIPPHDPPPATAPGATDDAANVR